MKTTIVFVFSCSSSWCTLFFSVDAFFMAKIAKQNRLFSAFLKKAKTCLMEMALAPSFFKLWGFLNQLQFLQTKGYNFVIHGWQVVTYFHGEICKRKSRFFGFFQKSQNMSHGNGSSTFVFQVMGILKPVTVSIDKGLQLFHSRMVGCHLISWRNLQKKIAFFRLFSRERSETCDTPKGIYFSELKNLGGGGVRDSPCAYASCIYFPCYYYYYYY